ncbi:MAG: linear amide C-N hydrolase [Acidobacteriota bacterium]
MLRIATALVTLIIVSVFGVGAGTSSACSVFQIVDGETVVTGYNFDWFKPLNATAYVNPRGAEKVALPLRGDKPAEWTARFGSVTFTGFGRGFPLCGMNETGLVVVQAWLGATIYPEIDERPSLGELQWIQYQLDTAEKIDDVIASDKDVRISRYSLAPLHFFVSDRTGKAAIIEFLDGKLSASSGERMPIKLMVNAPYQQCLSEYDENAPLNAENRFAVGAKMIQDWRPRSRPPERHAFATLDALTRAGTRWSVAFNSATREIHYRVAGAEEFEKFDADDLEYACGKADLQLQLADGSKGAGSGFAAYDAAADREQILASGATIPNSDVQMWEAMADYSRLAGCR